MDEQLSESVKTRFGGFFWLPGVKKVPGLFSSLINKGCLTPMNDVSWFAF
jgi:hypothetical protein